MTTASNPVVAAAATAAATERYGFSNQLIEAKSNVFPSPLSFQLRVAAWLLAILCSSAFYVGPFLLLLPLMMYWFYPRAAATLFCINIVLVSHPVAPWYKFRTWFQLFYHLFQFRHNLTPKVRELAIQQNHLGIVAMHPHAIIPLHAFLYAGFCDQFIPELYGVGTTTDGALRLPVLRHILQYLSVGSAHKQHILHAMQQLDQNLFILPGGVAEIFLSHRRNPRHPQVQVQVESNHGHTETILARRYGLMKLALQTGACIHPVYVFGATDIFDQLTPIVHKKATDATTTTTTDNATTTPKGVLPPSAVVSTTPKKAFWNSLGHAMESISRRIQGGLTLYWGQYFLPIPHTPRLTLVMGDPIYPVVVSHTQESHANIMGKKKTCPKIENPTSEQVEELMARYVDALERLFEQYKVQAGYHPNDVLQVL